MKVRDLLGEFSPEFLDLDAAGLVIVAATVGAPMIGSTISGERTRTLLDLVVNHGEWPTQTRRMG